MLNNELMRGWQYTLNLTDGSHWDISAEEGQASTIVSHVGCAMCLPLTAISAEQPNYEIVRRIHVRCNEHLSPEDNCVPVASEYDGVVDCCLWPYGDRYGFFIDLVRLSLVIVRDVQARGGILIHGALAERDGMGVLLAAPSGTGKSTASNRFPAPWRSRCDDLTLVLRDLHGNYWAHPWPTWSRFQDGGSGGAWDVQSAVPLKGIFFLTQADVERVEAVGPGHAASLLTESVKQAAMFMLPGLSQEDTRALHLEQFNNLCALVRVIPAHVLHISLTGAFWKEIEQVLDGGDPGPTVAMSC